MLEAISSETAEKLPVFGKEKVVNGERSSVECIEIKGQIYCFGRGLVRVASLEDEWYDDVTDPTNRNLGKTLSDAGVTWAWYGEGYAAMQAAATPGGCDVENRNGRAR